MSAADQGARDLRADHAERLLREALVTVRCVARTCGTDVAEVLHGLWELDREAPECGARCSHGARWADPVCHEALGHSGAHVGRDASGGLSGFTRT